MISFKLNFIAKAQIFYFTSFSRRYKIEDFIFQTHITNLLPPSSRNDVIYENCFEIVQSILNKENCYYFCFGFSRSTKNFDPAFTGNINFPACIGGQAMNFFEWCFDLKCFGCRLMKLTGRAGWTLKAEAAGVLRHNDWCIDASDAVRRQVAGAFAV